MPQIKHKTTYIIQKTTICFTLFANLQTYNKPLPTSRFAFLILSVKCQFPNGDIFLSFHIKNWIYQGNILWKYPLKNSPHLMHTPLKYTIKNCLSFWSKLQSSYKLARIYKKYNNLLSQTVNSFLQFNIKTPISFKRQLFALHYFPI